MARLTGCLSPLARIGCLPTRNTKSKSTRSTSRLSPLARIGCLPTNYTRRNAQRQACGKSLSPLARIGCLPTQGIHRGQSILVRLSPLARIGCLPTSASGRDIQISRTSVLVPWRGLAVFRPKTTSPTSSHPHNRLSPLARIGCLPTVEWKKPVCGDCSVLVPWRGLAVFRRSSPARTDR